MKTYETIEDLLATKKAQKFLDENLSSYNSEDEVYAVLETRYSGRSYSFEDLENAVNDIEHGRVTIYPDLDAYHDSCDELIECNLRGCDELLSRYFDYESYHDDCDYDVTEASNGIVVGNR